MSAIKRLFGFMNNPSSVVEGNANQPASQGNTENRPEPVDRLPVYRSRSFVGNTISHKNHKHIDDTTKYEIRAIDDQIAAALNAGKPEEIAVHLNALLDKTFFGPVVKKSTLDALTAAFERLDQCDIVAGDDEIDKYAREFAEEFVASAALGGRKDDIVAKARTYLNSTRAGKSQFQQEQLSQFFNADADADAQRCSAQKMALKTFESAFPVVAKTSGEDAVALLKKLITVLPDLGHHKIVERNAQRRGVTVLEKALEHLTHDQVAEVLAATMDSVALISTDVSNSLIEGGVRRRVTGLRLFQADAIAAMTGVSIGILQFAAGAGAAAATGFGVIPVGVITAAYGLGRYWTIDKQALGTALYMFSRKLEDLRKNWDKVSPENKERLTASFKKMRNKIPDLSGLKRSTAKRIHNDKFLDPSDFGKSNAGMELAKRAKHRLVAPITTRLKRILECESVGVRGFESATADQKKLCRLLESYHAEARRAGMLDTEIPEELLDNLLAHTEAPEYAEAFRNLTYCFNRVRKNNAAGAMPEYENPVTKPKILKKIVVMAKRLATGDKDFVQRFVTTARLAEENCHNNARQIFKRLWTAVFVEKAIKGEDGLDDDLTLLRLGMGFFREELLDTAKFELLGKGITVEIGIAVEIALGKTLGLPDPIEGMGHIVNIKSYTREDLANIKNKVLDKAKDRELFIDFLAEWDPLAKRLKESATFEADCKKKVNEFEKRYDDAQETFFAIDPLDKTDDDQAAFDHAAFELQHAKTAAAGMVIRERIGELLNTHWDALTADDPDEEIASGGVDKDMWEKFKAELAKVERVLDEGPRVVSPLETEEIARLQYIAPSGPPSSTARITRDDVPFDIVEKGAGGDCLFLALGEKQEDIEAVRGRIALAILARGDNEQARNRNAHHVAAALYQTPGEAQDHAVGLTYGRHAIPNSVYAKLVAIPGIYAGDDELLLYSTLHTNQGKTFVVVDQDGTLYRVKNGESERIPFTDENKAQVLHETLTNADVALYKTPNHWQQIALPGKIAEKTVEQDFLDATFTDEVRLLLEMLKEGDEEDVDLTEPQDNTHAANTGAIHAVAGGTATDPFNLQRFLNAQARNASGRTVYDTASAELKAGVKMGHWMWYVFPLVQGMTSSTTSRQYGISSVHEAQAYLADPVLGPRLRDCAKLVLDWLGRGRKLEVILGKTDAWKFQASMTLFAEATKDNPTGPDKVFHDCVASHGRDYKTDQQLRGLAADAGT